MPQLIDEILALPTIGQKIDMLKKGRENCKMPDTAQNLKDWKVELHDIMDPKKFPDRKIVTKKGRKVYDKKTGEEYQEDDKTDTQKANHIALPIEQDIINIQTGLTVGQEPSLTCDFNDDAEKDLMSAMQYTMLKNRMKYINKKELRAWLAEQEVAEYWYLAPDDDGFWPKIAKKSTTISSGVMPKVRLKCSVWSPFHGDILYPFFEGEELTAFMRQYKQRTFDGGSIDCYQVVTRDKVYLWQMKDGTFQETSFAHHLPKLPIMYAYRPEAYCSNIRPMRERVEKTLSSYADCIDYHFFPYLILMGQVGEVSGKLKNHVIRLQGEGASASYLTWDQVPDTIKFEVETYIEQMYSMKNTPRISFENLKDMSAPSGTAFHFYFMGAELQVSNHAEIFGEFLQRRVNFLISSLGSINSRLFTPSQTIDVETEIQPYTVDDLANKVDIALKATGDMPLWSQKHGMMFAGQIDHIDDEIAEIKAEHAQQTQQTQQKEPEQDPVPAKPKDDDKSGNKK